MGKRIDTLKFIGKAAVLSATYAVLAPLYSVDSEPEKGYYGGALYTQYDDRTSLFNGSVRMYFSQIPFEVTRQEYEYRGKQVTNYLFNRESQDKYNLNATALPDDHSWRTSHQINDYCEYTRRTYPLAFWLNDEITSSKIIEKGIPAQTQYMLRNHENESHLAITKKD